MTAPAPWPFPGGRTLAGWWRQFAPLQPLSLWVGHLLVHRIEALTRAHRTSALDPFALPVLRALALAPVAPPEALDKRLHLGRQVLHQLLRQLERAGLAHLGDGSAWTLTDLGRQALAQGSFPRPSDERRTFTFVQPEGPAGTPPQFLNLAAAGGLPYPPGEAGNFDGQVLADCLQRPVAWKEQHGFPRDVEQVLAVDAMATAGTSLPELWQRIMVDRPERFPVAVILLAGEGGGTRLRGFAVRPEGWVLQADKPVFDLGSDWPETLPDLAVEPAADAWRQAWRAWCQPRGLPASEVEACAQERHACRLRVSTPARLLDRLRAARSDALKGEAWVLAGSGRLRPAAVLEIVEAKPTAR